MKKPAGRRVMLNINSPLYFILALMTRMPEICHRVHRETLGESSCSFLFMDSVANMVPFFLFVSVFSTPLQKLSVDKKQQI
jgi:hypothetical protein